MDRRTLLGSAVATLGMPLTGCLAGSPARESDGLVRPDDPPTASSPLQCPTEEFTRHPSYYEEDAVEWGDTTDFSLRVASASFDYGEVAEIELSNTSDEMASVGTEEKYHVERYTEAGWQDVRGKLGGSQFDYVDLGNDLPPGDGYRWSIELTEAGLVDGGRELIVCPDLASGRYRFLYWGTSVPVAVSFDLSR